MADSEISNKLATKDLESPRVRVLRRGSHIIGIFVVGDGVSTRITSNVDDVFRSIVILLGTYYAFDLRYPQAFQSILRLMQKVVFNEGPLTGHIGKSLAFVARRIQVLLDRLRDVRAAAVEPIRDETC